MNKRFSARFLCLTALGAGLNVVCAFAAMFLRLPIYMDSVGTILVTALLGPKYGMMAGLMGSFLSGLTFDVYSFYYAPVQILTAAMAGLVMKSKWGHGWRMILSGILVSLPTSLVSAVITALVFGGQTSSASSYLVVLLHNMGLNLTICCFLVQIFTDYLDKLAAMTFTHLALKKGVCRIYGTLQPNHQ